MVSLHQCLLSMSFFSKNDGEDFGNQWWVHLAPNCRVQWELGHFACSSPKIQAENLQILVPEWRRLSDDTVLCVVKRISHKNH